MKTKHVAVLDYQTGWKAEFEKIRAELLRVLGSAAVAIEHVGSTSVEGLAAKPVIDVDIVYEDDFEGVKSALATLGYRWEGDLGIRGREAFRYVGKPHLMAHHLYACRTDSEELHRHLAFRDYLRSHPEDRKRYGEVKQEMAAKYPEDIESYMRGKQPVIEDIYRKCGLSKEK